MRVCVQAYVITALQMFSLDAVNASEFLEVYKGVVPPGEFSSMLDELTSGQHSFIHSLIHPSVRSLIHPSVRLSVCSFVCLFVRTLVHWRNME